MKIKKMKNQGESKMREYVHRELNESGKESVQKFLYLDQEVLLRHFYGNKNVSAHTVVLGVIT